MTYRVVLNTHAERQFRKVPQQIQPRLAAAIRLLATDPRQPDCRKLVGGKHHWRIRAADIYRVVYTIQDDHMLVTVVELDHWDTV
ncbi:MAG TPA: type II toxin-antitoxin system RelE/ParE family toxin [Armatimonadota bacterium]